MDQGLKFIEDCSNEKSHLVLFVLNKFDWMFILSNSRFHTSAVWLNYQLIGNQS